MHFFKISSLVITEIEMINYFRDNAGFLDKEHINDETSFSDSIDSRRLNREDTDFVDVDSGYHVDLVKTSKLDTQLSF